MPAKKKKKKKLIWTEAIGGLDEKEVWRALARNCTWWDNGKRAGKNGDMAERSGRRTANYIYRSSYGRTEFVYSFFSSSRLFNLYFKISFGT